jgi:predicted nucleotidyltransferase
MGAGVVSFMLARYSAFRRPPQVSMGYVCGPPFRDNGLEAPTGLGQIAKMKSEQVKAKLLPYVPELNEAGIVHLDVHGSVARGEATSSSDVDLIADFDRARRLTLFDLAGLESRLSDILEAPVDLSDRRMLKDDVRVRAQREGVLVF